MRLLATEVVDDPLPAAATAATDHAHLLHFRRVRLQPSVPELAALWEAGGLRDGVVMPLPDGSEVLLAMRKFERAGADAGVFTGSVAGEPGSLAILAFTGDAGAGSLHIPGRGQVFEIRHTGSGSIGIGEVDVTALGTCGLCARKVAAQHPAPATEAMPQPALEAGPIP